MNYYKMKKMISNRIHEWIIEQSKEKGKKEDITILCRHLSLQHGISRRMVENILKENYGLSIQNDQLVKE